MASQLLDVDQSIARDIGGALARANWTDGAQNHRRSFSFLWLLDAFACAALGADCSACREPAMARTVAGSFCVYSSALPKALATAFRISIRIASAMAAWPSAVGCMAPVVSEKTRADAASSR
jgi:hypothetical protein